MAEASERLSPGDWAVLGLVAEAPTHGFAVARLMAPDAAVGRIWTVPRPLVYRSLDTLAQHGLIRTAGTEPSTSGPPRSVVEITPEGHAALERWLESPVEHVRDARTILMLKLLFVDRSGGSPAGLLTAQRATLLGRREALASAVDSAEGFEHTLALWRYEMTSAVLRFTEALLAKD